MLLPTGTQMQSIDRHAIEVMGIPSLDLMEQAGTGVADVVEDHLQHGGGTIVIACGRGNNGGDGLVAARLLAARGYEVQVWLAAEPEDLSGDAAVNWDRLLADAPSTAGEVDIKPLGTSTVDPGMLAGEWSTAAVLVDALLGTGTAGAPRPPLDGWVTAMNIAGPPVVAVDVPSGVDADTGEVVGSAPLAVDTVTMAYPKRGLILQPGRAHAGRIHVVDIGIPSEAAVAGEVAVEMTEHRWASVRLPRRAADAHKGHFGQLVVVAGSAGMMGAARLVCAAAGRAGAGLVRHVAPASLLAIAHAGRDEIMVTPVADGGAGRFVPLAGESVAALEEAMAWADIVALGPGIGLAADTAAFLSQLVGMSRADLQLVIDADGLNHLAEDRDLRVSWLGPVVLTPHPGEAARLLGSDVATVEEDRVAAARRLAETYDAIAVLKGAPTVVAEPAGRALVCPLGNPGMATGGSGDVLTGMVAALLGQGMAPLEGAALAVYLHGLAGDLAALDLGVWSLMAGDLIGYLPAAFGHLEAAPDRDVIAEGVWG